MAESLKLPSLAPGAARHPAGSRPKVPHPPGPPPNGRAEPAPPKSDAAAHTGTSTRVDLPRARFRERPRRRPGEQGLRLALHVGFLLNATALLLPRLLPAGSVPWRYGGDESLLAAAVLLCGYGLLAVGRLDKPGGADRQR